MTDGEGDVTTRDSEDTKLAELDRLLNDPDVPMQPDRVWSLLAELARNTDCAQSNLGS